MDSLGTIYYDDLEFIIEIARFGYIRTSDWGAGWNFLIGGFSTATDRGRTLFPHGLMVFAEAAPLLLDPANLLEQMIEYSLGYYEQAEWGASWFECWTEGHNETWDVKLGFAERCDTRYRVILTATIGDNGRGCLPLRLSAWAEFRPPQDRPTGFALAPRTGQPELLRFVEQDGWKRYG